MASNVDIANAALRELGANPIALMTEDSESARKVNSVYEIYLRALLRVHPWSFAKKETALSLLSETPELEDYLYVFSLPPDFIRLNKTSVEPDYSHKIKGRKLYSNSNIISIEYGYYNTDPSSYDDMFVEAFAARIAAGLCYAITRDKDMIKIKWEEFMRKLRLAQSANGQEVTPDEEEPGSWLQSRI